MLSVRGDFSFFDIALRRLYGGFILMIINDVSRCYEYIHRWNTSLALKRLGSIAVQRRSQYNKRYLLCISPLSLFYTSIPPVESRQELNFLHKMPPTALDIVLRALARRPMNVYSSARATVRHLDKVLTLAGALTLAKMVEKDAPISLLLFEFSGEICWSAPLSCHSRWISTDRSRPLLYQLLIEVSQVFSLPWWQEYTNTCPLFYECH